MVRPVVTVSDMGEVLLCSGDGVRAQALPVTATASARARHRPDDIMRIGQSIAGFVANYRQITINATARAQPVHVQCAA